MFFKRKFVKALFIFAEVFGQRKLTDFLKKSNKNKVVSEFAIFAQNGAKKSRILVTLTLFTGANRSTNTIFFGGGVSVLLAANIHRVIVSRMWDFH